MLGWRELPRSVPAFSNAVPLLVFIHDQSVDPPSKRPVALAENSMNSHMGGKGAGGAGDGGRCGCAGGDSSLIVVILVLMTSSSWPPPTTSPKHCLRAHPSCSVFRLAHSHKAGTASQSPRCYLHYRDKGGQHPLIQSKIGKQAISAKTTSLRLSIPAAILHSATY